MSWGCVFHNRTVDELARIVNDAVHQEESIESSENPILCFDVRWIILHHLVAAATPDGARARERDDLHGCLIFSARRLDHRG
jgi:hypothetical protein